MSNAIVFAPGMVLSVCSTVKLVGLFSLITEVSSPFRCSADRFHRSGIEGHSIGTGAGRKGFKDACALSAFKIATTGLGSR